MKRLKKQSNQKHIPIRTCIATGVSKPKGELIRLVRLADEKVVVDLSGREKGRGANLDMNVEAFDLAVKKKAIERALKLEKNLTESDIETLREEFINALEERKFRKGNKPVTIRVAKEVLEMKIKA